MTGKVYEDSLSFAARLHGMRDCLAYIREEALSYRLHAVAECLYAACEEIDAGLENLHLEPDSAAFPRRN